MDDDEATWESLQGVSLAGILALLFVGLTCFWRRDELNFPPLALNLSLGLALCAATGRLCWRRAIPAWALHPWIMLLGLYFQGTVAWNYYCGVCEGIPFRLVAIMVAGALCMQRRAWLATYLLLSLTALVTLLHRIDYTPLFTYSIGVLGVLISLVAHLSARQALLAILSLSQDQANRNQALEEALAEAHRLQGSLDEEVRARTENLEKAHQELSLSLERQAGVFEEKSKLEKQIEEGRRLESIGRAAGACAHDLNNILAILTCSLECLTDLHPQGAGRSEISRAIERMARTGREMLTLSGRQFLRRQSVKVATLAEEWGPMLTRLLGEHYHFAQLIESPETRLLCDKQELFVVLANLLTNATEAMPDGGRVRLWGRRLDPGRYLVELRDEGPGIPPELHEQVFDPYFTTKPGHTGLGLSTARAFLRQNGGSLEVAAEEGGALLRLTLPIRPPGAEEAP